MKSNYKKINFFLGLATAMLALAGCSKNEKIEGGVADRLFSPVLKTTLTATNNTIDVQLEKINGAMGYNLEISRDTFKTIDQSVTVDSARYIFQNLKWNQLYQVRGKSLGSDSTKISRIGILGAIKTPKFPSILVSPTLADVSDGAAKVSWTNSGAPVTSVKVYKLADSSFVKEVALTSTDLTNQYRIITGLTGSTTYILYLYSGTQLRGWDNYTTTTPLTGVLVDLRGITDRPTLLQDTLPNVPAGATVLLQRGMTYTLSASYSIGKAVTIMSGADLLVSSQATINLPANFNLAANSAIDFIDFKDVYLQGTDAAAKYVFNITNAANVGRISFTNCKAEYLRGLVRLQNFAINVTDYTVNNCIIDSIGGYGILTVDGTTPKASNITITNSTIYKAEVIVSSKNSSNSINISNCTFNEAPKGNGNYLITYSTSTANNVTQPIKVYNNIFGIGKNNAGITTVKGINVGSNSSIDATGNYGTLDYVVTANAIPSITPYAKNSTDLWVDPSNGNFKFKDNSFAGKSTAGDPRWW